ncbi:MAG: hypothetical protein OQJ77_04840 [Thiovulaceae bacterium]|nr:hypothetical protein [Sulfurimonadaceae bacterium]MCW9026624.1 hypothetical protein [Sulfurimonadaceae bacterium]
MLKKIKLNLGEELKHDKSKSKKNMAKTEIYYYSIKNELDEVVGKIIHEVHTFLEDSRKIQFVIQKDKDGKTVVQESW